MSTQKDKGDKLEDAVEAIERFIFRVNPALKETNYIIERNKIIIVDGVTHEIDLFVEFDSGNEYRSTFIFECKNWDYSKVDKKEIADFSDKIEDTGAQKGFFISKGFTESALNRAKKNKRLELLKAEELLDISLFPTTHVIFRDAAKKEVEIIFMEEGSDGSKLIYFDESEINNLYLDGVKIDLRDHFMTIADRLCDEYEGKEITYPEGYYKLNIKKELVYERLYFYNNKISKVKLDINFEIYVGKPVLKSSFQIENKGRFLSFGIIIPNEGALGLNFITIKNPNHNGPNPFKNIV